MGMPQFCIQFYANYTSNPKGGHGTIPPPKYAPGAMHKMLCESLQVAVIPNLLYEILCL